MQSCSLQSRVVGTSFRPFFHPSRPAAPPVTPPVMSAARPAASVLLAAPVSPLRPSLSAPSAPSAPALDSVTVRGITVSLADVARVAPVLTFHPKERHFPCDIDTLLGGACLKGAGAEVLVQNPTRADLARHAGADNRLWLSEHHAAGTPPPAGNRVTAPMYVVVQVPEDRSYVDIRYLLLFAYQGAQAVRVIVPGNDFDTFLPHFGEHQGDIESVCLRLTPDLQTVTSVTFEQHGKPQTWPAAEVAFEGSHPVARCALEGHATYNARGLDGEARVEHAEETRKPIPGFGVGFIDLLSDRGARWAPHEAFEHSGAPFVFVGLDKDGQPVNQQTWVTFSGAIGGYWRNDYAGAQGIDKPLSFIQRTYVNGVVKAVVASGKLEERRRISSGTPGLGKRPWIHLEA